MLRQLSHVCMFLLVSIGYCSIASSEPAPKRAVTTIDPCQASQYRLVDLGVINENYHTSYANKINEQGAVVGSSMSNENTVAFLYTDANQMQDLQIAFPFPSAESINDTNRIGGNMGTGGSVDIGYFYENGSFRTIGTDDKHYFVSDLNNQNHVLVNKYDLSDVTTTFFIWQNGQVLHEVPGNNGFIIANSINRHDVVSGKMDTDPSPSTQNVKAFVWKRGHLVILSSLNSQSYQYSNAQDLDDTGNLIVGESTRSIFPLQTITRPVYWKNVSGNYTLHEILPDSNLNAGSANAVNNKNIIVGEQRTVNYISQPFLYKASSSELIDLRDRVESLNGWVLERATDINDKCQIIGNGRNPEGSYRAFRLDPILEV